MPDYDNDGDPRPSIPGQGLICRGRRYFLQVGDIVEFGHEHRSKHPTDPRTAVVVNIYPDGAEHIMVTFEARRYPSDFYVPHDVREAQGYKQWSMSITGMYEIWNVVGKVTPENRGARVHYDSSFPSTPAIVDTGRPKLLSDGIQPLEQDEPGPQPGDTVLYDGGEPRELDEIDLIRKRNRERAAAEKKGKD